MVLITQILTITSTHNAIVTFYPHNNLSDLYLFNFLYADCLHLFDPKRYVDLSCYKMPE